MAKKETATTKEEVKKLKAGRHSFTLIGQAKVGTNTFPPESVGKLSGFVSKKMNLGVDVGKGCVVYCEAFGGFQGKKAPANIIAYSKKGDGTRYEIAWEDRLTQKPETLADISPMSLVTVALEKLENDKLYYKTFLSLYDAIPYIQEHLPENARVKVRGKLTPNLYEGKFSLRKEVTFISLYDGDELDSATGQISVLVNKDSLGKVRLKQDGEFDVSARFVAYAKEINGVEVKTNVPYDIELVLPAHADGTDSDKAMFKYTANLFNTKKPNVVNEVGFEVAFEEGTLIQEGTLEDLDAESLAFIDMGLLTKEQALGKLSVRGGRINRIVILKPLIVKEEVAEKLQIRTFFTESIYTEDELKLPEKVEKVEVNQAVTEDEITKLVTEGASEADNDWLNAIMGN